MLVSVSAITIVANGLWLLAGGARQPTPAEEKAFAEGLRRYDAGDARGAAQAWQDGYAIGRDPAFLVRIGEAQEKAGAPAEAAASYERYLKESPDAADRPEIEARIRRLAPAAPPGATAPPPGDAEEAPGQLGGGAAEPVVPRTLLAPPARPPLQQRSDATDEPRRRAGDEEPPPRSGLVIGGWVAAGVTTALLGAAAFYGAQAASKAGDANRLAVYADDDSVPLEYATVARRYEDTIAAGRRDDRIAKGLLIGAGVTALGAAALFIADALTARPGPRRPPGEPGSGATLRRRPGGLDLSWTF